MLKLENLAKNAEKVFRPGGGAVHLRSPLSGWLGGKWLLSRKIVPLIAPHKCYVEPFLGAGWIFLRKGKSEIEILNDLNGDLINCWEVMRDNPQWIIERCRLSLSSRWLFDKYVSMTPDEIDGMTKEERAWRLIYILKNCIAGRGAANATRDAMALGCGARPSYKITRRYADFTKRSNCKLLLLPDYLKAVWPRLRDASFESRTWQKILAAYDLDSTFFYLDPPYMGFEKEYGEGMFAHGEYYEMAEKLARIKGRFLLSMNDCPESREIFGGFRLHSAAVCYSVCDAGSKSGFTELLISNYDFDAGVMEKYGVAKI